MSAQAATLGKTADGGTVFWITGLPGAGKRTLSHALAAALATQGRAVIRLDGRAIRDMLEGRIGFGLADRRLMGHAYARLCQTLSEQGFDVVFATVSLLHDVQTWNRENLADYREIHLSTSADTIAARLPKGLIAAARAGRLRNVPGVDLPAEAPRTPDVVIADEAGKPPADLAVELLQKLGLSRRRAAFDDLAPHHSLQL